MSKRAGTLIACVLAACALPEKALCQSDPDTKSVLATVQTLLDGWREADAAKLESVLHKDFREVTLHLQDGAWGFAVEERATLIGTMPKIQKGAWDDQLIDPQVHIDGPMAIVWSKYKFTVHYTEDGVAHAPVHCGTETFQLYKEGTAWKIVNFADTHSDNCP
ncbi:MAG: nuclear transport factor 2 family protein [Burkholderiaceae bacterium]